MSDDQPQPQSQAPPPIQPLPPIGALPPSPPPQPGTPAWESEARTWHMFCHLSALSGYVIPFGNLLGPFVIWQVKKNSIPSIEAHGKAALNFQITVMIALLVSAIALFILSFFCLGFLLLPAVFLIPLAAVIFPIIAAVKANNGEHYKYPLTLELLK